MQRGNPMQLNFEELEKKKRNILMDVAHRVDEKNEVICLFIMFTPRAIIIKMSKMGDFCIFCLWQ